MSSDFVEMCAHVGGESIMDSASAVRRRAARVNKIMKAVNKNCHAHNPIFYAKRRPKNSREYLPFLNIYELNTSKLLERPCQFVQNKAWNSALASRLTTCTKTPRISLNWRSVDAHRILPLFHCAQDAFVYGRLHNTVDQKRETMEA